MFTLDLVLGGSVVVTTVATGTSLEELVSSKVEASGREVSCKTLAVVPSQQPVMLSTFVVCALIPNLSGVVVMYSMLYSMFYSLCCHAIVSGL